MIAFNIFMVSALIVILLMLWMAADRLEKLRKRLDVLENRPKNT